MRGRLFAPVQPAHSSLAPPGARPGAPSAAACVCARGVPCAARRGPRGQPRWARHGDPSRWRCCAPLRCPARAGRRGTTRARGAAAVRGLIRLLARASACAFLDCAGVLTAAPAPRRASAAAVTSAADASGFTLTVRGAPLMRRATRSPLRVRRLSHAVYASRAQASRPRGAGAQRAALVTLTAPGDGFTAFLLASDAPGTAFSDAASASAVRARPHTAAATRPGATATPHPRCGGPGEPAGVRSCADHGADARAFGRLSPPGKRVWGRCGALC